MRKLRIKGWESDDLWEDPPFLPDIQVDDARDIVFTGILDPQGNPIVRLPNPIGFGRDDEWDIVGIL